MTLRDDLLEIAGDVFTDVSSDLSGFEDIDLVQVDEETDQYETVYTIQGKWFFDNTDRGSSVIADAARHGNYLLYVANESEEMNNAMKTATHTRIGEHRYVINRPDTVPPSLTNPMWQIYCDHEFV